MRSRAGYEAGHFTYTLSVNLKECPKSPSYVVTDQPSVVSLGNDLYLVTVGRAEMEAKCQYWIMVRACKVLVRRAYARLSFAC